MNNDFHYNPFSGVLHEDIQQTIIPSFNVNEIINKIKTSNSLAIEFIGKQGRGKTSHLLYLQQTINIYPIFLLDDSSSISNIIQSKSDIVFIDSIHRLNIKDRIRLFKEKKVVIYTTHWSRKVECFLTKKHLYSISFKGIDAKNLSLILNRRLKLASKNQLNNEMLFSLKNTSDLIKKFGDNYRAIINHLYEQYQ